MTCYYKVYLYKVRWPVIAKLNSYFTTKFKVLVQIGQLKLDIQIILQLLILAKRFQETFPFSRVFIFKEFVANGQNTNQCSARSKVEFHNLFKTCKRCLTSNTQHCSGRGGLTWIAFSIMKVKVTNVLTRIVCFPTVKQAQLKKSLVYINTSRST